MRMRKTQKPKSRTKGRRLVRIDHQGEEPLPFDSNATPRRLLDEPPELPVSVWAPSQISAAMIPAGKIQPRENLFTQDHAGRGSFAITALTLRRMSASS